MIRAMDAIKAGRALLGTPYSELDCINFIKKIIRTAEGGDKKYQTAGTDTLWNSYTLKGKYHDLTWRETSIATPRPGMLAFKGKATDEKGDGEPHHVGLVTERGTVLHSSSAKGQVVETPLEAKEGWTLLAQHKLIEVVWGASTEEPREELSEVNEVLYSAVVNELVEADSWLNLRSSPAVSSKRVFKIPAGAKVDVVDYYNDNWVKVNYNGLTGYCFAKYLTRVEDDIMPIKRITLVIKDEEGNCIPIGGFTVRMMNNQISVDADAED